MQWLLLFIILSSLLYAAPALSTKRQFQQPDGTTFSGKQRGDEYLNWIESQEGDILLYNKKSRQYEYATIDEDGLSTNGQAVRPSIKGRRAIPLNRQDDGDKIRALWEKKRQKALQRQKRIKSR